jgi:hypothetical protein
MPEIEEHEYAANEYWIDAHNRRLLPSAHFIIRSATTRQFKPSGFQVVMEENIHRHTASDYFDWGI